MTEQHTRSLEMESIAAEAPKFTAPMLLIHGSWCRAGMWRPFMGYLAHRGWTCRAPHLRGHAEADDVSEIAGVCFADYLRDVQGVIAASATPPVLVGHDIGGLLALRCAAMGVRAVVALAPLIPVAVARTSHPVVSGWAARLAKMRRRPIPPPRGKIGAEFFAQGPPGGMTPESPLVGHALAQEHLTLATFGKVPILVIAGERDRFCSPLIGRQLALSVGATFLIAESATHAMPWEPGWEQRVAETHRWLIRSLGEPLLLLSGEEE